MKAKLLPVTALLAATLTLAGTNGVAASLQQPDGKIWQMTLHVAGDSGGDIKGTWTPKAGNAYDIVYYASPVVTGELMMDMKIDGGDFTAYTVDQTDSNLCTYHGSKVNDQVFGDFYCQSGEKGKFDGTLV